MARARFLAIASAVVAVGAITLSTPTLANKAVYRCTVQGRVVYADEPCGAQAREVRVDDARTGDQRREAQDAANREAALASKMRRDRLEEERLARTQPRRPSTRRHHTSQASVEYSNASGKVTKTVKAKKAKRDDIDESMPIYIDVPKAKDQAPIRR